MADQNNPSVMYIDKCKHKHLFKDPRQISKLQASTRSSLIQCSYFLRVNAEYDDCICCDDPPTIDIPVIIYTPDVTCFDESVRPSNWQPAMLPLYNYAEPGNNNNIVLDNNNDVSNVRDMDLNQASAIPIVTTSKDKLSEDLEAPKDT
jgi:hypothetical protein